MLHCFIDALHERRRKQTMENAEMIKYSIWNIWYYCKFDFAHKQIII